MLWLLLYNIAPILFNCSIGVLVLALRPRAGANRWFFVITLSLSALGFSEIAKGSAGSPGQAVAAEMLGDLQAIWLPLACYFFFQSFYRDATKKPLLRSRAFPAALTAAALGQTGILLSTPWVIEGAEWTGFKFAIRLGPAYLFSFGLPMSGTRP
ncbi:MAG: hypothetical protein MUC63_10080 [Planctomycetes bacterium]|nr:hypothetical protein [Planctomycetota bacterium]